ncbi:hypothetical protein BWQ96_04919 [Gracilariopsis chorda]|uniref:Uncharacterized protein n=1 Tax=Gracilariopsis chorda TaxID=448386 RepID=A0A2V3IT99_9FLOR|nr:hypothetical protein BWQ96_04919 [Gracilariopsis chorda]|eukprot:PXF45329.1 hypothetical protein BWQ96_04919 [Gracilariopsis chorda]
MTQGAGSWGGARNGYRLGGVAAIFWFNWCRDSESGGKRASSLVVLQNALYKGSVWASAER